MVDKALHDRLKDLASREQRSLSGQVVYMLNRQLEESGSLREEVEELKRKVEALRANLAN